jgi:hypothetical protein
MTFKVCWEARAPKAPPTDFWDRCKEEAFLSNVPAWMIAENNFHHDKENVTEYRDKSYRELQ